MSSSSCLLTNFRRDQEVDLTISGFVYSGTFLGASGGVVVVEDPFELNFIAAKYVTAASPPNGGVSKRGGEVVPINCVDPLPALRRLLKSLRGTPVLLQVQSSFLQGIVKKVSKSKNKLYLTVSSAGSTSTTVVSLQDLMVVLVPLSSAGKIVFGDPETTQFALRNNSSSPAAGVLIFQPAP